MVGGVLTAHAKMRPAPKGQETALKSDVFFALFAEAVWVKVFRPGVGLQHHSMCSNSDLTDQHAHRHLTLQKFEDENEVQICMYACNRVNGLKMTSHDEAR